MFGPGGGGGFLNMGTPELVVIGAVAWALLGPKELYRLARQAGEFLGEWQQLGTQARDTFKEAIESEMREDELKKTMDEVASPFKSFTPDALKEKASEAGMGIPPLADYAETKRKERQEGDMPDMGSGTWVGGDLGREVSEEERAELYAKAVEEMGDPVNNAANFASQMSGERNQQVLEEFPQELSYDDWVVDPLAPEEDLISTQIAEAENQLATLRAEAKVLGLRRQQQQSNAARAQALEEEEALSKAEKAVGTEEVHSKANGEAAVGEAAVGEA